MAATIEVDLGHLHDDMRMVGFVRSRVTVASSHSGSCSRPSRRSMASPTSTTRDGSDSRREAQKVDRVFRKRADFSASHRLERRARMNFPIFRENPPHCGRVFPRRPNKCRKSVTCLVTPTGARLSWQGTDFTRISSLSGLLLPSKVPSVYRDCLGSDGTAEVPNGDTMVSMKGRHAMSASRVFSALLLFRKLEDIGLLYRRARSSAWQAKFKIGSRWVRTTTKLDDLDKAKQAAKELFIEYQCKERHELPVIARRFADVGSPLRSRTRRATVQTVTGGGVANDDWVR